VKLILAYKLWGNKDELEKNAVEYLHSLYIKITSETEIDPTLEEKTRNEFKLLSE
jgi:arginyl-tRNA synthetase